jgi:hypothetical protein
MIILPFLKSMCVNIVRREDAKKEDTTKVSPKQSNAENEQKPVILSFCLRDLALLPCTFGTHDVVSFSRISIRSQSLYL